MHTSYGLHIPGVAAERVLAGLTIPNASHIALKRARGTQLGPIKGDEHGLGNKRDCPSPQVGAQELEGTR